MSSPRIAIVGAGPAGLTLGVLLHNKQIPFSIYELRPKPTEEALAQPSGMLDLHEESGLTAIRTCGLYDEFLPLTGECAELMCIANLDGTTLHAGKGDGHRPEIARHALTKLLLSKLPADAIRWKHKLLRATAAEGNTTELDFGAVHGTVTADLVIGADGAWSRVRPLLTPNTPLYTGVHWITMTIPKITTRHPHLADMVGPGTWCALGEQKGVIAQRSTRDSLRIYLAVRTPDAHFAATAGLAGLRPREAKQQLVGEDDSLFAKWGAPPRELIERACEEDKADELDVMGLHMLPLGKLAWAHRAGVTLVGDAAHLMPPAGEGVNMAMWDALDLAVVVEKAYAEGGGGRFHEALEPLMREFEKSMVERAGKNAEDSWGTLQLMFFDDDAAEKLAAVMKTMT
ncbi:salicylate hydroxylase [Mycena galericulata]|nr:salicylate hydroxylase [Mycena galericulata]